MKNQLFMWLLAAIFICGCSVRTPEVQVTGEKTALENQVIGTYEQMQDDSWMVASTRNARNRQQVVLSDEKDTFLEAKQNRAFNEDDVNEFKNDGALGENNLGMLELRPLARLVMDQGPSSQGARQNCNRLDKLRCLGQCPILIDRLFRRKIR